MAKKKCLESCKGQILDANKGRYCRHIEAMLPKYSGQSVTASSAGTWIESLPGWEGYREVPPHEIEIRLKRFGLDKHEVELIMLRYVEDKTMKQIVSQQGWTSVGSAAHFLRSALKKLRKGGFQL